VARSTDQISRDIAETRAELDTAVSNLEGQTRANVRRVQRGGVMAVGAGIGLLIFLAVLRRLRRG
jgi:hypothetical protein